MNKVFDAWARFRIFLDSLGWHDPIPSRYGTWAGKGSRICTICGKYLP